MTKKAYSFLAILYTLQKIDPEFPLQYGICLAEISIKEGLSLTSLAKKTGMQLSTISRIVGALSSKRQNGQPYEFIDVTVSPQERRRKQIHLTKRGHEIMDKIINILPANDDQILPERNK